MKKKIWVLVGIAVVFFVSSPQAATKVDGPPLPIPAGFPPTHAELSPNGKIEGVSLIVWYGRKLPNKMFEGGFWELTPDGKRKRPSGDFGRYGGTPEGIIFVYNIATGKTMELTGSVSMVYDRKTKIWTVSGSSIRKPVSLKGDNSKEVTIPPFSVPPEFPPYYSGLPIEEKTEGRSLVVSAVRELSAKVFESSYWNLTPDGNRTLFSGDSMPRYGEMLKLKEGYIFVYNVETEKTTRLAGTVSMVYDRKTGIWTVSGSMVPK